MKKLISSLIALLTLMILAQSATAQDSVNPGDDPNLALRNGPIGSTSTEAVAAALGVENCPKCMENLKHNRLGDNTTYRPETAVPDPDATSGRR